MQVMIAPAARRKEAGLTLTAIKRWIASAPAKREGNLLRRDFYRRGLLGSPRRSLF